MNPSDADRDDLAAILREHLPWTRLVAPSDADDLAQMVLESDWLRGVRAKELRDAADEMRRTGFDAMDRWLTVRAENVIGNERKTPCEQPAPTSESVSTLPTTVSGATEASTIPANTSQRRCKTSNRCSCGPGDACSECDRADRVDAEDGGR